MGKRVVAAFDFDGTLTTKDTLLEFIQFAKGKKAFFWGFMLYSPLLIAYKLKLFPNWKMKQLMFSYFFKNMDYTDFCLLGERFAERIETITRTAMLNRLEEHRSQGAKLYVISASIEEWVKPWCHRHGIENVLATKIEIDQQKRITGRFLSENCYGQEKVNRLNESEPYRNRYYLYAYGDSRGDKEMLAFADSGYYVGSLQ